ncbi:MAG: PLP-dependent transferase, partial [Armatimonadota bacterium]
MSDAWTDDATMLQHLGDDDHILGAVVPPIFQNSLFVFKTLDEFEHMATLPPGKHAYSRITNPTVRILEQKVAALERSEEARIFSSGMAAISSAVMSCVKTGDHIVCVETAYGPLKKFLAYLEKFDIT